jgi:hypothetical protein
VNLVQTTHKSEKGVWGNEFWFEHGLINLLMAPSLLKVKWQTVRKSLTRGQHMARKAPVSGPRRELLLALFK